MKLTIEEIIDYILNQPQDIIFHYNGKEGYIFPFYVDGKLEAYMRFEDYETPDFNDIDEIMNFKFIEGKSLNEVGEDIIFF